MEILEVYCVELDEVVDIYDAQNAYFDLSESSRRRFTFRCSDDECRRVKNPLVFGVNYHQTALLCRNAPTCEGNLRLPAPMHMAKQLAQDHPWPTSIAVMWPDDSTLTSAPIKTELSTLTNGPRRKSSRRPHTWPAR